MVCDSKKKKHAGRSCRYDMKRKQISFYLDKLHKNKFAL